MDTMTTQANILYRQTLYYNTFKLTSAMNQYHNTFKLTSAMDQSPGNGTSSFYETS